MDVQRSMFNYFNWQVWKPGDEHESNQHHKQATLTKCK